jgi:hypothetical protein
MTSDFSNLKQLANSYQHRGNPSEKRPIDPLAPIRIEAETSKGSHTYRRARLATQAQDELRTIMWPPLVFTDPFGTILKSVTPIGLVKILIDVGTWVSPSSFSPKIKPVTVPGVFGLPKPVAEPSLVNVKLCTDALAAFE